MKGHQIQVSNSGSVPFLSGLQNPVVAEDAARLSARIHFLATAVTFFRPTPYGFRQVVQHVSNHVACEIN